MQNLKEQVAVFNRLFEAYFGKNLIALCHFPSQALLESTFD